jgi:LAO/AO transport system kinase
MISEDPQFYVQGVLNGDRRLLAKTITVIESSLFAHQQLAGTIIDLLLPYAGKAIRLGITGVPGVGKSTFIESLGTMLVKKGHRVAVLAVDPSSKRSGGSVLADKTRMEKLAVEEKAFIRPSPSGGTLGGVARKTRETMIVETVGVGQSETTVASMVDFFLVLMISGAGDELQGIKKGILELADAVAVNKADGDNVERAEFARKQYETALHFLAPSSPTWTPPVLTCSALEMIDIDVIWDTVTEHHRKLTQTGELIANRKKQAADWMWSLVKEGLNDRFYQNPEVQKILPETIKEVENGTIASTIAANRLLDLLDNRASD